MFTPVILGLAFLFLLVHRVVLRGCQFKDLYDLKTSFPESGAATFGDMAGSALNLSRLPKRIENRELIKEQLRAIFGENGWMRLPDEVYSRVEYQPAVKEVVEHHVAVYAAKKNDVDKIVRADHPVDLLRNSIATPSLVAAIINAKYTNAIPLYRIAQD